MTFIPYARPVIDEEEIQAVVDTLRTGWLTTGPNVAQFEEDFKKFIKCDYALAVNSATAGLHLALEALGVGPNDKVITTIHTFTATAEVIRYLGADPLFADIDKETFNIDPDQVESLLKSNPEVKVIIPVHYGGQAADMTRIMHLAQRYNVKVLEDAAHALPCTHNGKLVGTMGDVTVFSFYANKTITTGEGGMVTTNNSEIAARIKVMRLHGINRDAFDRFTSEKPSWYYEIVAPGFKYNMMDICGALGIQQLKKAHAFQNRRAQIAARYNEGLSGLPVETPVIINSDDCHAWHIYVLKLQLELITITRDQFINELSKRKIGSSVHYIPLHRMPYWKSTYELEDKNFPNSTEAYNRIVSLPNFASMTDSEVDSVISAVRDILEKYSK